jgi:hypothetical protein
MWLTTMTGAFTVPLGPAQWPQSDRHSPENPPPAPTQPAHPPGWVVTAGAPPPVLGLARAILFWSPDEPEPEGW